MAGPRAKINAGINQLMKVLKEIPDTPPGDIELNRKAVRSLEKELMERILRPTLVPRPPPGKQAALARQHAAAFLEMRRERDDALAATSSGPDGPIVHAYPVTGTGGGKSKKKKSKRKSKKRKSKKRKSTKRKR
jgi:hypothetical protein